MQPNQDAFLMPPRHTQKALSVLSVSSVADKKSGPQSDPLPEQTGRRILLPATACKLAACYFSPELVCAGCTGATAAG